jgi:outer membrane protein insertion porin family
MNHRYSAYFLAALALCVSSVSFRHEAVAQAPLSRANDNTEVTRVSFRFVDSRTFDDGVLQEQIFTRGLSFWERIQRSAPLVRGPVYPLRPIEVQRDVVRLRRYYERQGFLFTRVDYGTSQLDPNRNAAHIIFTIDEGPPLLIEEVGFFTPDGDRARTIFGTDLEPAWDRLRDRVILRTGERYTDFARTRIEDQILAWLRDQGFAYAQVGSRVTIDTLRSAVDLRFVMNPGPVATIDNIVIEGLSQVNESVVRRALPFREGDRFVHSRLIEGQRKLFGLRLFRVALVDVPPQPVGETVAVRVRVTEARPRFISALTGYSQLNGIEGEASWRHRNLFGGAQEFVARTGVRTGWLIPGEMYGFDFSLSFRQPHMFIPDLSGIVAPFYERRVDLRTTPGVAYQEGGLNTTLLYEIHPFRTVSLQHTFARVGDVPGLPEESAGAYNRSRLTLSGNFGQLDDYFMPRRGFMVRPSYEIAGVVPTGGVQFQRYSNEIVGYHPLTDNIHGSARLFVARTIPFGTSRTPTEQQALRLQRARWVAGGANDVRGWSFGLVGPVAIDTVRWIYRPIPQFSKISANLETRFPFPGLGSDWSTATFLDFGQVADDPEDLFDFKYSAGGGIRYETIVGFIRLDLGFKLNPEITDLYGPFTAYQHLVNQEPLPPIPPLREVWRRANLHISIGQIF